MLKGKLSPFCVRSPNMTYVGCMISNLAIYSYKIFIKLPTNLLLFSFAGCQRSTYTSCQIVFLSDIRNVLSHFFQTSDFIRYEKISRNNRTIDNSKTRVVLLPSMLVHMHVVNMERCRCDNLRTQGRSYNRAWCSRLIYWTLITVIAMHVGRPR